MSSRPSAWAAATRACQASLPRSQSKLSVWSARRSGTSRGSRILAKLSVRRASERWTQSSSQCARQPRMVLPRAYVCAAVVRGPACSRMQHEAMVSSASRAGRVTRSDHFSGSEGRCRAAQRDSVHGVRPDVQPGTTGDLPARRRLRGGRAPGGVRRRPGGRCVRRRCSSEAPAVKHARSPGVSLTAVPLRSVADGAAPRRRTAGGAAAPGRCRSTPPAAEVRGPVGRHGRAVAPPTGSLEGDGGAGALELLLGLLGGLLVDLLQDRLRRAVDEVLGLLEAEGGQRADLLDDLDLLVAGGLEDDVELVLLLGRGLVAATGGGGRRPRRRPGRRR